MNIIAAFEPEALGVKEGELTGAVADMFVGLPAAQAGRELQQKMKKLLKL